MPNDYSPFYYFVYIWSYLAPKCSDKTVARYFKLNQTLWWFCQVTLHNLGMFLFLIRCNHYSCTVSHKERTTLSLISRVFGRRTWLAYVWPWASQGTLETQAAEGHKYTQAPLIQMLNILLNFPGGLSPNPTQQTNGDEWLHMKAGFKCIMLAFIFPLSCLLMVLLKVSRPCF